MAATTPLRLLPLSLVLAFAAEEPGQPQTPGDATSLVQQEAAWRRRHKPAELDGSHASAACPNPVGLLHGQGCRCTAGSCGDLPNPIELLAARDEALIVTSWKDGKFLEPEVVSTRSAAAEEGGRVQANSMKLGLDVEQELQKVLGFGGAVTDAAAFHFHRLEPAVQEQWLRRHYGAGGAGYTLARVPMGASDFSRMDYTLDNVSGDTELEHFCLRDDSAAEVPCGTDHKATVLKAAQSTAKEAGNGELKLFVSPWSPPLWYKNQNFKCRMKNGLYICNPARVEKRDTTSAAVLDPSACKGNGLLEDCPTASAQEIGAKADGEKARGSAGPGLRDFVQQASARATQAVRHLHQRRLLENSLLEKPSFTPDRPDVTQNLFNRGFLTANDTLQASWAKYFSKFIEAYQSLGVEVWGLTVQNEPGSTLPLWQGTYLSPKMQANFLANHLGPTLRRDHPGVKIMVHDDSLTGLPTIERMLLDNPKVASYVDGVGYHWYLTLQGTYENSEKLRPAQLAKNVVGGGAYVRDVWKRLRALGDDKFVLMTEACNGFSLGTAWLGPRPGEWGYGYSYSHDVMWQLLNGAAGWTDWNLMLGPEGGPNVAGNFVDSPTVWESPESFLQNPSFFHLAHYSKYVLPGSRRVAVRTECGLPESEHCQAVGFLRPDGMAAVVLTNDEISVGPIMDLNSFFKAFVKVPKLAMGHGKPFTWTIQCGSHLVNGTAPWRSIQTVVMPCS